MISSLFVLSWSLILEDNYEIFPIDYYNVYILESILVISVFIFLTVSIDDINLLSLNKLNTYNFQTLMIISLNHNL